MRDIYEKQPSNKPRLETDILFADYKNEYLYHGNIHDAFSFVEELQLLKPELWCRFVRQFREEDADSDNGWRGEYWGKMMRGASFVYSYTRNPDLYGVLKNTVIDMIDSADGDGRISSYSRSHEFRGWDIWARKYVMLGMQYFLEICDDPDLTERAIVSMKRQADYIISHIGDERDGKIHICKASNNWRGLNSSSILEPIVRLYTLTGEKRYYDFAEYIVNIGGTDVENIFELAYRDEMYPYQYPITKAYEMTSCFEGLLEFYRITHVEKYKTAIVNFANKVLESDFTVIGSAGCTHELFDHSSVRQANTDNGKIMQETCVTVTLMKFLYQLNLLTADPKYVDAFETSLYNAYLGSFNTERVIEPLIEREHPDWAIEPLPFDSYSPLTAGTRGNGVGGLKCMSDKHYYGCCACIGSAGLGLVPKIQALSSNNGIVINLFIDGEIKVFSPTGRPINISIETDYPKTGTVRISLLSCEDEEFEIMIRNPAWSNETNMKINGVPVEVNDGYVSTRRVWKSGDVVDVLLDMTTKAILPLPYGTQILMNKSAGNYMLPNFDREDPMAHRHIALRRGPVILAQENRLGYSVDDPVDIIVEPDGSVATLIPEQDVAPYPHIVELLVPLSSGEYMRVTDYSSAGKLWSEESKMAAWMLTE